VLLRRYAPCTVLRDFRVSPLSPSSPSLHQTSFTVHPWAIAFLWEPCETSGHGGTSSRATLLVSLALRVQSLRRIQAQRTRGDPPIWKDVTMSFVAKVLDLPCRPRSHYKKLLHERDWTIGHNSYKEASTAPERRAVLTCTLAPPPTAVTKTPTITSSDSVPLPICISVGGL